MAKKLGYMQMRYVQDIYKRDMQKKINFEKDKQIFRCNWKKRKYLKMATGFFQSNGRVIPITKKKWRVTFGSFVSDDTFVKCKNF